MKNILNKGCLFFVLTISLVSCGSSKPVLVENATINTKTITETIHDTIFKIEKDSSYYQAYLECQDGKVVVKNVTQSEPGRSLKSPKVRIDNNILKVDCEAKAQELFAFWKSQHVSDIVFKTVKNTVLVNQLTFFQKAQIYAFRLIFLVIVVIALWLYIKSKFTR